MTDVLEASPSCADTREPAVSLSIVTTLYRSAPYIKEFYARASRAASNIAAEYEIVFVNDGSPDDSLQLAIDLARTDRHARVVDLSRNFGHHRAIMTGLAHARGDLIFLVDSDLEEDPLLLDRFYAQLQAAGADVAFGVQETRKGSWFEQFGGALFFRTFNALSSVPITPNLVTARLMTRRYLDSLLQYTEREIVLSGLWALTGYKQVPVPIKKYSKGSTSYSVIRRATLLVDAIASFSSKPLTFIFYAGATVLLFACLWASIVVIGRILFSQLLEGWTSLIVSIWVLGGLVLFCLGVVAIYVSRIFVEVKQRPRSIVRHVYRHPVRNPVDLAEIE